MKKVVLIALCLIGCAGDPKKTSPQPTPVPNPTNPKK
jgi:hypothetical protein